MRRLRFLAIAVAAVLLALFFSAAIAPTDLTQEMVHQRQRDISALRHQLPITY